MLQQLGFSWLLALVLPLTFGLPLLFVVGIDWWFGADDGVPRDEGDA